MLVSDFLRYCGNQKIKIRIVQNGDAIFTSSQINIRCLRYYPYYIDLIEYTNLTLIIYISNKKNIDGFGMKEDKIILPANKIYIADLYKIMDSTTKICLSINLLKNNDNIKKILFDAQNKDIIFIY